MSFGVRILRSIEKHIDKVAILFAVVTIPLLILCDDKGTASVVKYISGILGLMYALMFFYLWFFKRVDFDRYLVQSNYLIKVICIVLLMPATATILWPLLSYAKIIDTVDANRIVAINSNEDNSEEDSTGIFWSVYYHFIDPGNQHMATGKWERLGVATVALAGVFLMNGLLVSSVIGWIDRRKELWRKGGIKYSSRDLGTQHHYVIIGASNGILGIIRTIFGLDNEDGNNDLHKRPYLIIQTARDVEVFRRELFSELSEELQQKVIICYGNRTSEGDLEALLLEHAQEVYILGENIDENDAESYHDTMNMVCVKNIGKNIAGVDRFFRENENNIDKRLVCRVMFEYQATFNVLQTTDINHDKINFSPFNYYEMWAQKILVRQELMSRNGEEWCPLEHFEKISLRNKNAYMPIDGYDGIKSTDDSFVHFVVVGMSRMGVALAIEVAHLAHYPNFDTKGKRTRITFIDPSMEQEMSFFKGRFKEMFAVARQRYVRRMHGDIYNDLKRYPWKNPLVDNGSKSAYSAESLGGEFVDIEWEFINGSLENPCVQEYLVHAAENENAKLTIAVCLPNNSQAVAGAAYIDDKVYAARSLQQVLVYQKLNNELINQINENKRYNNRLRAFGMANEFYESSLVEIDDYIGKLIDNTYNQGQNSLVDSMIARMKRSDETIEIVKELCPSYTILDTAQREYVKKEWKKWLKDNPCSNDNWRKNKMQKHIEIDKLLGNVQDVRIDESESAKMWSTHYNVNTMWTKFRSVSTNDGQPFNPLNDVEFDQSALEELARVEHNRWCVERLLMRYRPLTEAEQKSAKMHKLLSSEVQKELLKERFAHLDICSNERLREIDVTAPSNDIELTRILPATYRKYIKDCMCKKE